MEWLLLRIRAWGASAFAVPLGLFGASLLLHALTFLFHGPYALGYDTGFYRRYLIQPFISFPNAPVPGLGGDALVPRVLLDTLRL
ncbi:hypothetical protein HY091_01920, partial [Candidatus Kaiserbacteria bacterium]|nr:hypothetical protein [Candidatus Kaiserbacteria bacterium]